MINPRSPWKDVLVWNVAYSMEAKRFPLNLRTTEPERQIYWNLYAAPLGSYIPSQRHWDPKARLKKAGGRLPYYGPNTILSNTRDCDRSRDGQRTRGNEGSEPNNRGKFSSPTFCEKFRPIRKQLSPSRQQASGHTQHCPPRNHEAGRPGHHRGEGRGQNSRHGTDHQQQRTHHGKGEPASWQNAPGNTQRYDPSHNSRSQITKRTDRQQQYTQRKRGEPASWQQAPGNTQRYDAHSNLRK